MKRVSVAGGRARGIWPTHNDRQPRGFPDRASIEINVLPKAAYAFDELAVKSAPRARASSRRSRSDLDGEARRRQAWAATCGAPKARRPSA